MLNSSPIAEFDQRPAQFVAKALKRGGKTKCAAIAFASAFLHDPTPKIFVLSGTYWQARRLY
jgi:hypothetical protein